MYQFRKLGETGWGEDLPNSYDRFGSKDPDGFHGTTAGGARMARTLGRWTGLELDTQDELDQS